DLVPVEGHLRLEPQGVARPKPARLDPELLARVEDRVPGSLGFRRIDIDFEPVLARVPGAGDAGRDAADLAVDEPVITDRSQIRTGQLLHGTKRLRALN